MNLITLTDEFSIKKIEASNEKDLWMIEQLESDSLVCGPNGYLWHISSCLLHDNNLSYLLRDIYNCPFSIYHDKSPIGFLEISKIYKTSTTSSVELSYALIEEERKKGYMSQVLTATSDYILADQNHFIDEIDLEIHIENIASQNVAKKSGFIKDDFFHDYNSNFLNFYKTKKMIKK